MQDLTITMLQMDLAWQNPIANMNVASQLIADIEEDSDLFILPEMFNTGFTLDAAANAETMDGPTVTWMQALVERTQTAVCGSLIVSDNGKHYNR
ncbi:MAG: nitrilase-related carbon-nitrogen hydrolase, partial [Gammaproteobacteria bacterium]|nr:nitrilase-related carbon-nitrogen hydrolase [Gammaproteobacteria bacterium]